MIKVLSNRAKAIADIEKALGDGATSSVVAIFDQIIVEHNHWQDEVLDDGVVEAIFDQIVVKQNHWEDEVVDDGVVELMNSQFECFVLEAKIM